jgi:hypothetical protein
LITGSLLGGGYIRTVPGRRNAFLEINHSYNAKDYVDWKYSLLKGIVKIPPHARRTNGKRIAYRFFTRQHPEITRMWQRWYVRGQKKIPMDLMIDPLTLAVWFMDDGSSSGGSYYLNSQQFDWDSQEFLMKKLKVHEIHTTLNRDKEYFRIRIIKESMIPFRKMIESYVVPSMRYKLC